MVCAQKATHFLSCILWLSIIIIYWVADKKKFWTDCNYKITACTVNKGFKVGLIESLVFIVVFDWWKNGWLLIIKVGVKGDSCHDGRNSDWRLGVLRSMYWCWNNSNNSFAYKISKYLIYKFGILASIFIIF